MKINVVPQAEQLEVSAKEKQIIHIALLNILALLNAIITKKGMVSNSLEDEPKNLGYELHFENNLTQIEEQEFMRRATNQIETFLSMSEIPYDIEFEN